MYVLHFHYLSADWHLSLCLFLAVVNRAVMNTDEQVSWKCNVASFGYRHWSSVPDLRRVLFLSFWGTSDFHSTCTSLHSRNILGCRNSEGSTWSRSRGQGCWPSPSSVAYRITPSSMLTSTEVEKIWPPNNQNSSPNHCFLQGKATMQLPHCLESPKWKFFKSP